MFAYTNANLSTSSSGNSFNLSIDYFTQPNNQSVSQSFMEDDSQIPTSPNPFGQSYHHPSTGRMAHRRSHAEIASDSEPEESRSLYLSHSDEDDDPVYRRHPVKRTRLSSGADVTNVGLTGRLTPTSSSNSLNQSLQSPSMSASSLPPRPQRSRSLGDVISPFHRELSPASSPSSASSRAAANRKMGLSIVPPSSITRTRSFLPFSPRTTATQFLGVPTVQHSPRATLPVSDSPLENLFSQLTMQTPQVSTPNGCRQPIKGFSNRVSDSAGDPNYPRRSLSISISPSPEVMTPVSAALSHSPVFTMGSLEAHDPPKSSWLVRVDSAEDMLDEASNDCNSALPSILTGAQMTSFFASLRRSTDPEWLPLALAWKWQCQTGGVIHRHEFVAGMQSMGCESLTQLDARVQSLKLEIEAISLKEYKQFFIFVFHYLRQAQSGNRKTIGIEIARRLLQSMLRLRFPKFIEDFSEYLEHVQRLNPMMRLTADTWISVLDFAQAMSDTDYVSYARDESCAFPSLFDEFIQWMKMNRPSRMSALIAHEKLLHNRPNRVEQQKLSPASIPIAKSNSLSVAPFEIKRSDERVVALDDDPAHMNGYEGDVENNERMLV